MRTRWSPQQGSALVIVLPLILILTLLGSISLQNTLQEVRRVSQERNGLQVFYLAEAGAERARQVLAATGDSPTSWDLDGWDADSWTDELLGQDGRPNTADDGILYFGPVVLFNGGEYRVKIVDNDDSDGNLFKDVDDTVKIISVGKVTAVNPVNTTTTTTKEATIEMLVHRFRVKHLGAVYLAGSKGGAEFSGDTFLLSGDDHKLDWSVNPLNLAAVPGITTNGSLSRIDLATAQKDNVLGLGFKLSPLTSSLLSTQETAEVQGLADIYTARADNVVAP
ncbi:MAG: hypothetical protein HY731_12730, partial [Candidatus Tectomicrobia bacterium]|nr:hypothetical protein [Candidatus Tectomicrobia bacterium]